MKLAIKNLKNAVAAGVAMIAFSVQAAYPDKPIKLIVAFPPGSSTDLVARVLAQQMTLSFGQSVVVENRPGASGNIATTFVAKQPADGYTLLMHSVAIAVNPSLYAKAGYDVNTDLEAIVIAGVSPNVFFVHPDVKAKTLAELIALSKKEKLSYASSGNGTTTHLGAEIFFRNLSKTDIQHIPYAPATAVNAVLSGQVPVGSTSVPPVVQLAKTGKVRALAVTSKKRSSALPDVPTVAELGFKDFEANTWFAMFAPANTPVDVLQKLNTEINKISLYKTTQDVFAAQSLESARMDRVAVKNYVYFEAAKWGKVVKQIGAKVD
jgi:tripartite-type tricarboxylate transporter receptor subunit TctC